MGELSPAIMKKPFHIAGRQTIIDIEHRRLVLHRVPDQVREDKNHIFDPVLVSLGPYHYDPTRFPQVEDLKSKILNKYDSDGRQKLLEEVQRGLTKIRIFYNDLSKEACNDDLLAEMMVRDACFVVYCMKMKISPNHDEQCMIHRTLGLSRVAFVIRDFFMLENQLPLWILNMAISLTLHDEAVPPPLDQNDHGSNGVEAFFCERLKASREPPRVPHLLHARRETLINHDNTTNRRPPISCFFLPRYHSNKNTQFRSVKDLKAKGIHFRPSSTSLTDITFRSHSFYGKLRLPILTIDSNTNVIFSNMIALEMSPCSGTDFSIISYVKFMKSLIVKADDVKELREKGIILSCTANDEEVVKMFKEFNTDGSCSKDLHRGVREEMNEHCRSKAKTFKAEFIHTYFRSPWTAIALFAACLLLVINCLNFFLNYYRMKYPAKRL